MNDSFDSQPGSILVRAVQIRPQYRHPFPARSSRSLLFEISKEHDRILPASLNSLIAQDPENWLYLLHWTKSGFKWWQTWHTGISFSLMNVVAFTVKLLFSGNLYVIAGSCVWLPMAVLSVVGLLFAKFWG